jgi:hypothetical protein
VRRLKRQFDDGDGGLVGWSGGAPVAEGACASGGGVPVLAELSEPSGAGKLPSAAFGSRIGGAGWSDGAISGAGDGVNGGTAPPRTSATLS